MPSQWASGLRSASGGGVLESLSFCVVKCLQTQKGQGEIDVTDVDRCLGSRGAAAEAESRKNATSHSKTMKYVPCPAAYSALKHQMSVARGQTSTLCKLRFNTLKIKVFTVRLILRITRSLAKPPSSWDISVQKSAIPSQLVCKRNGVLKDTRLECR